LGLPKPVTPPTDTQAPTITPLDGGVYTHQIGDQNINYGCEAEDDVDGIISCTVTGFVDMSTAGNYIVTYYAIDSAGNETTIAFTHTVVDPDNELILSAYYSSATSLTGEALLLELRSIINTGFIKVSYGDSRYILDESDRAPNNSNNLILLYLGTSVSGSWDNGVTWNREHVWPQSYLGTNVNNDSKNVGSDLHNLKPANPSANTSRSNQPFSNDLLILGNPVRLDVRGDLARILFYMVVMYDYLELINDAPYLYKMAYLNTLIEWHEADPVDDFERNRNDVIYSYQKNRNPFIDYPEFVDMIFSP
jgi:endonuclease I